MIWKSRPMIRKLTDLSKNSSPDVWPPEYWTLSDCQDAGLLNLRVVAHKVDQDPESCRTLRTFRLEKFEITHGSRSELSVEVRRLPRWWVIIWHPEQRYMELLGFHKCPI